VIVFEANYQVDYARSSDGADGLFQVSEIGGDCLRSARRWERIAANDTKRLREL
jgi:hypothetical protein